jgi:hypothetical protein
VPGFFKNPLPGEVTANCKACKPEAVLVPFAHPEAWHVLLQFPFTVNVRSERAPDPPTVTAPFSPLQTVKKRLRSKLQAVRQELRKRWHERIAETGDWLRSVVQGYFNYHAVPGNFAALQTFRREIARAWLEALKRRSQRHRLPWERFRSITDRYLPLPRILHPQPGVRFDAR